MTLTGRVDNYRQVVMLAADNALRHGRPTPEIIAADPKNCKYTGTETRQIFSRTLAKILKGLFALTLNEKAVSVQHVSSVSVFLHAGLND